MKLVVLAASLAVLPNCAAPRTAIVTGAVGVVAGALVYHDAFQQETDNPFVAFGNAAIESTAGVAIVTAGAALVIAGLVGLGQEAHEDAKAPLPPIAQGPVMPVSMQANFAPPGSATAVLAARSDGLATQLQLEARAGHCEAATAIARRLAVLDRARAIALIERDGDVSSCVAVQL